MKIAVLFYTLLISFLINAQGNISGNLTPAENFKWIIVYELTPSGENYVADTAVENGTFVLNMPSTAQNGIYRLVYAVPQNEYFFEVLYKRNEKVALNFDNNQGLQFTSSQENKLYLEYFEQINEALSKLEGFYKSTENYEISFNEITKEITTLQNKYEIKTKGLIAHEFIIANKPYVPLEIKTAQEYLEQKKINFFDHIDFKNKLLLSSSFLTNKIIDYVFALIPDKINSKEHLIQEFSNNIIKIDSLIKNTPDDFKIKILKELWYVANSNNLNEVSDLLLNDYLRDLAIANGQQTMINEMEAKSRLRLGAIAPNIKWTIDGKEQDLENLTLSKNYIFIFWSSTCSHCLKELPALHKKLSNFKNIQVLAVGLEDNEENWKEVSLTLPNFTHAIALGKWESEYAKTYDIRQTPTYYIFDSEKRFIAKPKSDKEVVEFLTNKK